MNTTEVKVTRSGNPKGEWHSYTLESCEVRIFHHADSRRKPERFVREGSGPWVRHCEVRMARVPGYLNRKTAKQAPSFVCEPAPGPRHVPSIGLTRPGNHGEAWKWKKPAFTRRRQG